MPRPFHESTIRKKHSLTDSAQSAPEVDRTAGHTDVGGLFQLSGVEYLLNIIRSSTRLPSIGTSLNKCVLLTMVRPVIVKQLISLRS